MRVMNSLLFLIALFGLGLSLPSSGAAEPSCVVTADHALIGHEHWYGLYYDDRKIGHAVTQATWNQHDVDGEDHPTISQHFSMTFKLEQSEETIEQTRRFDAHPPHRLLDGVFTSADRHLTFEQHGDDLHLQEDGLTRVWPDVNRDLCDEEDFAIHRFLAGEPSLGARFETADIDIEHQEVLAATHELEAIDTRRILGADHRFQTLRTTSSSPGFAYNAQTRFQNGEAVNLFLGPIEMRAESATIAHQPNRGVDLFAEFEKPLNRPLTPLSTIETLTLRASIDDDAVTIHQVVKLGFGQHVDYLDDKTALVHLVSRAAAVEEGDVKTFLRATSSHPADHPRLQAMVAEIKASLDPKVDDHTLATTLLRFVAGYIETVPESPYAYHTTSIFDVLDNRKGDCTEYSQLFVTLARAAGLPAREVSGFVYGGDDQAPSLSGHAWVEVLLNGEWIGMDPTWNELELNKSHVQVVNTLVPSLTFEVVDLTHL